MAAPAPLASLNPQRRAALRRRLDGLHRTFDRRYLSTDPLAFVHRYATDADREIVGFLTSGLAFGNVRSIERSVGALLLALGPSPSRFVERFDASGDAGRLRGLYHRWIRSDDLAAVLAALGRIRREHGSIERFFLQTHLPGDVDLTDSLSAFCERARRMAPPGHSGRIRMFFPSPRDGSACKRLNLFLRWMVRDGDGLDLGIWGRVPRRQLVLPLDTHLVRLSRALGLTRRRTPGWRMAVEATRSLALLDPDDPVKYDFSLSRLGILDLCLHGTDPLDCRRCPPPAVREAGRQRRAGAA